jgi:ferredoxin
MSDDKKKTWHGIAREEIPWLPTVDAEACMGCPLCYVTAYEFLDGLRVRRPDLQIVEHDVTRDPETYEDPRP